MRTAFFWAITQRVVVIPYRRFGITYRSHLQGSRIHKGRLLTDRVEGGSSHSEYLRKLWGGGRNLGRQDAWMTKCRNVAPNMFGSSVSYVPRVTLQLLEISGGY